MANFQPPPTWALPVLVDERTQKSSFNPIWLKWFVDLTGVLNAAGGTVPNAHNSLSSLQGGSVTERYHLTSAEAAVLASGSSGTGALVRAAGATLTTPALGTPTALVGTNITGTAAGLTAGSVTTNANLTGHITSAGNAAVLGSFTSAQLAAALTNETGSGVALFAAAGTELGIATAMVKSANTFNNGAAAGEGTLLNAPAAGNPTKWIPIDDNGTIRYLPAW